MQTLTRTSELVKSQRLFFQTGNTKAFQFRLEQLYKLKQVIQSNEETIFNALKKDLNKPKLETKGSEIGMITEEINYAIKRLKSWMKPRRVKTPLLSLPGSSQVMAEPLGVVLIIGAWNYPLQLTLAPLVGAIAAGNCAILKPSEIAPATSKLICDLIQNNFESNYITVVEGDKDITQELLHQKFDHIFFTGSSRVGKIIMEAAAKKLTPVTLELGGKSPCIVELDSDLEVTARRIVWGKFINAGQTCIAPDYLLVHRQIKPYLISKMRKMITHFYGENPTKSPDYGRIVSDRHFENLRRLIDPAKVIIGGDCNPDERYIAPTLLDNVTWEDEVMEEEIFGPILPLLEYENLEDAIAQINNKPKPLALYIFTRNKNTQDWILHNTSSGGVCVNDTILHISSMDLPFGGVGNSGIGQYHGKASFDTFSHYKSVLKRSFFLDLDLRYPPYAGKLKIFNWLFR